MALAQKARMASPTLDDLAAKASACRAHGQLYSGDISPENAHAYLLSNPGILVDVRTPPQWEGGVPDISDTQGKLLTLSWKTLPSYALNPDFIAQLAAQPGINSATPLFFMCKGGSRSLDAAIAVAAHGYRYCFNITGGFEGDGSGRPGTQGWKATPLPYKRG